MPAARAARDREGGGGDDGQGGLLAEGEAGKVYLVAGRQGWQDFR